MPIFTIKETMELASFTTDANGSCYMQKRINLQSGFTHNLLQTDIHAGSYVNTLNAPAPLEVVFSPYPSIPTSMYVTDQYVGANRLVAAGSDTVLFKITGLMNSGNPITANTLPFDIEQFPSPQIASQQKSVFYSDHIYISVHFIGEADTTYFNLNLSFMLVVENKSVSNLTSTIGKLAENHEAMCAELMSNGHMISKAALKGNVFPMWRYGGIRPEFMLSPESAGSFFLQLPTVDDERMQTTAGIRTSVAAARDMSAYDAAFGDKFPDWVRFNLNPGFIAGEIRDQWPPIKHADSGNVLCL